MTLSLVLLQRKTPGLAVRKPLQSMQYQTNYPYATTSQQYGAISQLREEQRRRQQEYSQALAQQVAQREQQKRRERELDQQYGRRFGSFHNPPQPQQGFGQPRKDSFEPSNRGGMLDGLGHNNHQISRTSFARGQQQQQQSQQQLHHRLPGGPELYPPQARASYGGQANFHPANQPNVGNQSVPGDFGIPGGPNPHQPMQQEPWPQQQPASHSGMPGFVPGPHAQTGWPEPNPQSNAMTQARNSQFWPGQDLAEPIPPSNGGFSSLQQSFQREYAQPEPPGNLNVHNGGRRQRTDIHDGGRGDSEEAERLRRKLQQQQEMQLALERQIEEKRQQKLEAKRRQEEEDRREMERFEEDQRRQRAEQERLQEEKRRKAALEQEKAELAAAAVAAANQQAKLQQQQKLHAQAHQPHPPHHQPTQHTQSFHQQPIHAQPPLQLQQPDHFNAPSPSRLRKNPFTNSRAHLFEDPPPQPSPQRGSMMPNGFHGHSNQNASPVRGGHQGFQSIYPQESQAAGRSMGPLELRRQYDDMREELIRQKQLVDQLRQAQVQIQQQQLSPVRAGNGNLPTLMDLEKLRNELRGELEYREQLHRQELESLKREQQQERGPEHAPTGNRYPDVRNSLQPASDKLQQRLTPLPEKADNNAPSTNTQSQQQHRRSPVKKLQTSQTGVHPIGDSLMSLRGESEFVYFDGRVTGAGTHRKGGGVASRDRFKGGDDGDSLDQQSESKTEDSRVVEVARSSLRKSATKKHSVKLSVAASASSASDQAKNPTLDEFDSEDESQGFVIQSSPVRGNRSQQLATSPTAHARRTAASSHRYSQLPPAFISSSPSKQFGQWRLESVGTNNASDSDDELDASLDGEQLEALFQRNVRRHEILLGFQTRVQAQTKASNQHEEEGIVPQARSAWTDLHQQLEDNRRASIPRKLSATSTSSNDSTHKQTTDAEDEAALIASSKWMPSSLLLPMEQTTRSTLAT